MQSPDREVHSRAQRADMLGLPGEIELTSIRFRVQVRGWLGDARRIAPHRRAPTLCAWNPPGAIEGDVPRDLAVRADLRGRDERPAVGDAVDHAFDEHPAAALPEAGDHL